MIQCDFDSTCKHPAVVNIQSGIIFWDIDADGNYSDNPTDTEVDDEVNLHLCEEHKDQWTEI